MSEDYPVSVNQDGIKIKTEKMKVEEIYYCFYQDKLFLFFKDEHSLLNCYEVEDKEASEAIKANPDTESIKQILQKYVEKQQR